MNLEYFQLYLTMKRLLIPKNNIVLLGEVGAGKTTLLNKLVYGDFQTGRDCTSITNEVQICSSVDNRNIISEDLRLWLILYLFSKFNIKKTLRNIPI